MVDFNCFQMMMVTRNAELEMEQSGGAAVVAASTEARMRMTRRHSCGERSSCRWPRLAAVASPRMRATEQPVVEAVAAVETEVEVVAVRLTNMHAALRCASLLC